MGRERFLLIVLVPMAALYTLCGLWLALYPFLSVLIIVITAVELNCLGSMSFGWPFWFAETSTVMDIVMSSRPSIRCEQSRKENGWLCASRNREMYTT